MVKNLFKSFCAVSQSCDKGINPKVDSLDANLFIHEQEPQARAEIYIANNNNIHIHTKKIKKAKKNNVSLVEREWLVGLLF